MNAHIASGKLRQFNFAYPVKHFGQDERDYSEPELARFRHDEKFGIRRGVLAPR
jgi:hypothetical protein